MRRALATTALTAGIVLGGAPLAVSPALAADVVVASQTDTDEPANEDGDDDSGRWGLLGLTGLFGLFGYQKYKEHRADRAATSGPIGDVDSDGSGSRRV